MFRIFTFVALAGLVLQAAGCGPDAVGGSKAKTVPLTGTLTVDGKTRGNVAIQFLPQGSDGGVRSAYADVKEDGSFSATTYVTGDGVVPGKYDVRLGAEGDNASTDPALMMAAAAGSTIEKFEIDVPADGLTDVKLNLVTSGKNNNSGNNGTMLGQ